MNLRRWILGHDDQPPVTSPALKPPVEVFMLHDRTSALGRAIAQAVGRTLTVRVLHDAADVTESMDESRRRGRLVVLIVCDSERARVAGLVPVGWFAEITSATASFMYVDPTAVRVFRNGALLLDRPIGGRSTTVVTALVERVLHRVADGISNTSGVVPGGVRATSARRARPASVQMSAQPRTVGRCA